MQKQLQTACCVIKLRSPRIWTERPRGPGARCGGWAARSSPPPSAPAALRPGQAVTQWVGSGEGLSRPSESGKSSIPSREREAAFRDGREVAEPRAGRECLEVVLMGHRALNRQWEGGGAGGKLKPELRVTVATVAAKPDNGPAEETRWWSDRSGFALPTARRERSGAWTGKDLASAPRP